MASNGPIHFWEPPGQTKTIRYRQTHPNGHVETFHANFTPVLFCARCLNPRCDSALDVCSYCRAVDAWHRNAEEALKSVNATRLEISRYIHNRKKEQANEHHHG